MVSGVSMITGIWCIYDFIVKDNGTYSTMNIFFFSRVLR